jgi:hypothetical protein
MANDHAPTTSTDRPSVHERINALAQHRPLFENIDRHPQSGVYNRFLRNWSRVLYYAEGEVYRRSDAVDTFLWERTQSLAEEELETEFGMVMKKETNALLLHGMYLLLAVAEILLFTMTIEKVATAMGRVALAPLPSKEFMDDFRSQSRYNSEIVRAANGELLSQYGQIKAPVSDQYATVGPQNRDPAQDVVRQWLMDPLITFVSAPFRSILLKIPMIRKKCDRTKRDINVFSESSVNALAGTVMVMVAVLCATAAIFTLDVVKKRQVRILIMAIYAMAFALPMQLLGPSSLPLYSLVIS